MHIFYRLAVNGTGRSASAASWSGLASIQPDSSKGQQGDADQAACKQLPAASSPVPPVGHVILNSVQQARWGKHRVQKGVNPDAGTLVQRVCQPLWDLGASCRPRTHQRPVPAQLLLSLQEMVVLKLQ